MVDASLQATNPTPNAITGLRAVDREVPPLPPHTLEGHAHMMQDQMSISVAFVLGYKVSHVALLRCIPASSCYLVPPGSDGRAAPIVARPQALDQLGWVAADLLVARVAQTAPGLRRDTSVEEQCLTAYGQYTAGMPASAETTNPAGSQNTQSCTCHCEGGHVFGDHRAACHSRPVADCHAWQHDAAACGKARKAQSKRRMDLRASWGGRLDVEPPERACWPRVYAAGPHGSCNSCAACKTN